MQSSTTQYKIKLLQSLITEDCGKNKQWATILNKIITKLKKEEIRVEIQFDSTAIDQAIQDGNEALELIEKYEILHRN
jgi:peptidoglycan hydrolase-like amidase